MRFAEFSQPSGGILQIRQMQSAKVSRGWTVLLHTSLIGLIQYALQSSRVGQNFVMKFMFIFLFFGISRGIGNRKFEEKKFFKNMKQYN